MTRALLTLSLFLLFLSASGQTISESEFKRQALELEQTRTYIWKYSNRVTYGNSLLIAGALATGLGVLLADGGNDRQARPLVIGGVGSMILGGVVNLSAVYVLQKAGKRPGGERPVYTEK